MGLPWFRVDSHIGSHDKILQLLSDPSPKSWQAAFSYICSIGWSVDQETDGRIPKAALPFVHATPATARLLVTYRLWRENSPIEWEIVNFAERQQTTEVTLAKTEIRRVASEKANCKRWHGDLCWKNGTCSRAS